MKLCKRCHEVKPVADYYANRSGRDGLRPECKECTLAAQRKYYERTRDKQVAASKRWAENNRERSRAIKTKWRVANRDKQLAAQHSHYERCRESALESRRKWREANPGKGREYVRNRRARIAGNGVVPYTDEQLRARIDYYGGKCWICRVAPFEHLDHVKPLSRGGPHMLANLRPACASCNHQKSNTWPLAEMELSK